VPQGTSPEIVAPMHRQQLMPCDRESQRQAALRVAGTCDAQALFDLTLRQTNFQWFNRPSTRPSPLSLCESQMAVLSSASGWSSGAGRRVRDLAADRDSSPPAEYM
jgi:hypothetical protein